MQWWWRRPRASDTVEQVLWADEHGPVAAVWLTSWTQTWQCDPMRVPTAAAPSLEVVWARAQEQIAAHAEGPVETLVRDDDLELGELVRGAGFHADGHGGNAWLDIADRPEVRPLPDGLTLVDRSERIESPHPMRARNGDDVAQRLAQCSLYDPSLDLSVETADGRLVGYSLFWFDRSTRLAMIEPVRVEDEFQRRGVAPAMIAAGIERLVAAGAETVKIGWSREVAGALYERSGFSRVAPDTMYVGSSPPNW